ncbi:site-specific integrase [Candidatus Rhodobacter oscarellae]|uniref:site-specific integrase n=1 Tax=Candidatus Rhodobacter oscarellae TaxID=1675527 RepID=UPI0006707BFC|nr:site-specific integrase [Candidatus Rhodobacter lobularis]
MRFRELVPPDADYSYRVVLEQSLISGFPVDPENGYPVGLPDDVRALVNLVNGADIRPEPTLEDAKRLYLEERLDGGEGDAKKDAKRLERVFVRVKDTLGECPALSSLTYEHARKVRDHMLTVNGLAPSSVKRELNFVKAALSLWQRTHPQDTVHNPFAGLEYGRKVEAMGNKRSRVALPPKVLKEARAVVLSSANTEAQLVWRLLEGTGCRLAEVTGLREEDVVVTGDLPHIVVTWHEDRRVKGQASARRVPLVGDALNAAQQALQLPLEGHMAFPRYGKKGGPTTASKVLMNKLRKVTLNKDHVVHSLRHNMKGLLVTAGVEELVQNVILGHSLGGIGNKHHLGDDAKLKVAKRAMERALKVED